tara:strand:+ start:409 stop:936 length:528 start_codon:yes stop_codon:yes gene_type:complete
MEEQFKQFYENKRYIWFVSTLGNVKTINKSTGATKLRSSYRTGGRATSGYLGISTNNAPEKYIHRIVASTFIPNPENKATVNHIDGNKTNNHIDNLEWATYIENMHHAVATGLIRTNPSSRDMNNPIRRAEIDIRYKTIIELREAGASWNEIGEEFNISRQLANISWKRAMGIKV